MNEAEMQLIERFKERGEELMKFHEQASWPTLRITHKPIVPEDSQECFHDPSITMQWDRQSQGLPDVTIRIERTAADFRFAVWKSGKPMEGYSLITPRLGRFVSENRFLMDIALHNLIEEERWEREQREKKMRAEANASIACAIHDKRRAEGKVA